MAGMFHAAVLLCGAAGFALLAAWIPLIDRLDSRFVLRALDDQRVIASIPVWLVGAATVFAGLSALVLLVTVWRDARLRSVLRWCIGWAAAHPLFSIVIALSAALGAVDFYELFYDPYSREHGVRVWMLREDLQAWLGLAATVAAGVALWIVSRDSDSARRAGRWLRQSLVQRRKLWMLVAAVVPLAMGAGMCRWALEGIPHFSDSLTYLIQGRILQSGHVALPAPKHPDLLTHSLFFLTVDGRYFGKYPPGWPALIGSFDRVGLLFMANAAMAALATVLTGLVARQFASRRVAVLAAVLFGLSPWVWFHGAGFASHVASTCAVLGFVWLFLRALRTNAPLDAVGAGLVLGAAVIVRPFDAAMFALPAVFMVLWRQVRDPKRWLLRGSLVAVAALVGVGIYMAVNANTTGSPVKSPYALESRWDSDWNPSPLPMLARACFQFTELNARFPGWGIGGITLALAGAFAVGDKWRRPGLRLLTASTLLFFFGSTAFGFTNVWWGPRWLLPVAPLLAILAAHLVDRMICAIPAGRPEFGRSIGTRAAAQLSVCILIAGLSIGAVARYAGRFYQHTIMPPHLVSGDAHRQVTARLNHDGVADAIVAMPITGDRPPLDPRAGIAFMAVPFEKNPVIYVRAVDQWPQLARESFPGRELYELIPNKNADNGFVINKLDLE